MLYRYGLDELTDFIERPKARLNEYWEWNKRVKAITDKTEDPDESSPPETAEVKPEPTEEVSQSKEPSDEAPSQTDEKAVTSPIFDEVKIEEDEEDLKPTLSELIVWLLSQTVFDANFIFLSLG